MDYLSNKLKETIKFNNKNNQFNLLLKTSTKMANMAPNKFITKHSLLSDNNLNKKQLFLQSNQKIIQSMPKRSFSQRHLILNKFVDKKRSNSNIRINSRKSQRKMSVYIKQHQKAQNAVNTIKQTTFMAPINSVIQSSSFQKPNIVLKISDVIYGINSQLLLVINQNRIKQNNDYKKLQQIIKQTKKQNAQTIQLRISQIKNFLVKYQIKNGTIKVDNLMKLSKKKVVSNFQIVSLFDNFKEILKQNQNLPGIKFYYPDIIKGKIMAAKKIISFFKVIKAKKYTLKYSSLMNKVKLIQKYWRKCLLVRRRREKVFNRINQKIKIWQQIQQKFEKNWEIIKSSKKIQIHICSLSFQIFKRMTLQKKQQFQNSQINRIFRSYETDTLVIYVSPLQISIDLIKYYQRLFKVSSKDLNQKVTFIVPQNINKLSQICELTTTNYLLNSPKSLKKIKKLIKYYQSAYIVPSYPSVEYINLSVQLNIPILGSLPSQSKLLSTKIGCQQIFQTVCKDFGQGLKMLKSVDSIYSEIQFLNSLAILIFKNQNIQRWYFKIDDQVCGRGLAYFNVSSISFLKNLQRKNNKESLQQIQDLYDEKSIIKLIKKQLKEKIKSKLKIIHKDVYPTYSQYLTHFLTRGGLIQASPMMPNFQQVSVSFFIQPNGDFQILGTYQKLSINSRSICQSIKSPSKIQLDYQVLIRNFYRKLYQKRKMYGYFSIDMLYDKQEKIVYPIGLDCFLNTCTCSLIFTKFITGGLYKKDLNKFIINQENQINDKSQLSLNSVSEIQTKKQNELYFYYYPKIQLTNLQNLKVFFKKCKFQNISFDIKSKTGTLFILMDDLQSESVGFLCCQTTLQSLNMQANHTVDFLSKNYRIKKGKNKKQFDQIGFLRGFMCLSQNNNNKNNVPVSQISLSDLF